MFMKQGQYVSEKEISALVDRYDRSKDGRISYNEFLDELQPKANWLSSILIMFYV